VFELIKKLISGGKSEDPKVKLATTVATTVFDYIASLDDKEKLEEIKNAFEAANSGNSHDLDSIIFK
jgi:hypothetical protein